MKHPRSFVLAATAILMGTAHATVATFTLIPGQQIWSEPGDIIGNDLKGGQFIFDFSENFSDMLGINPNVTVTAAPLGHVVGAPKAALSVDMPLSHVKGAYDDVTQQASVNTVASKGGFTIDFPQHRLFGAGGSLTITDITVDLSTHSISADLAGSNNVNAQDVRLWTYAQSEGAAPAESFVNCTAWNPPTCWYTVHVGQPSLKFTDLAITEQGTGLFTTALGLTTPFGQVSFSEIQDFGTLTISPVPEPSGLAMGFIGLAGLAFALRRASGSRG